MDSPQAKLLAQLIEGVVLRAVVDYDKFQFRIIELPQISYRYADGCFFIVGRHDDRDGRREWRVFNPSQTMTFQPALVRRAGFQSHQQHHQVSDVAREVVPEQRVVGNLQEPNHRRAAAFFATFSVAAASDTGSEPDRSTLCSRSFSSQAIDDDS